MIKDEDELIAKFITYEEFGNEYPDPVRRRISLSRRALAYMLRNGVDYKVVSKITYEEEIETIRFLCARILTSGSSDITEVSSRLIVSIFRIIYEKSIRTGEWEVDNEQPVLFFMLNLDIELLERERTQLPFWGWTIQNKILKEMIGESGEEARSIYGNVVSMNEDISSKASEWKLFTERWEQKVEEYRDHADQLVNKYNFFGLADAFRRLVDQKSRDLQKTNRKLLWMGLIILLPLLMSAVWTIYAWNSPGDSIENLKNKVIFSVPAIVPIEVILIYYFRIILKEQLSLKAQILQLELRYSVCAFIQQYAKFAKELGGEQLARFESLIFSGVTPDPMTVPSTFDGMEQLANLMQKFQK